MNQFGKFKGKIADANYYYINFSKSANPHCIERKGRAYQLQLARAPVLNTLSGSPSMSCHLYTAAFSSAYCCLLICMLLSSHLHAAILDELSRHLAACAYLAVLGFDKLRSCFLQVACFT